MSNQTSTPSFEDASNIYQISTNGEVPARETAPFNKFTYVKEKILYSADKLTYKERMVLLAIWSHSDGDGTRSRPTRATIVLAVGIGKGAHGEVTESDEDKVTPVLKKLCEKGYIIMTKDNSASGKKTNVYALLM